MSVKIQANLTFVNMKAAPLIEKNTGRIVSKGNKCMRVSFANIDLKIALKSTKLFKSCPMPTWNEKLFGKRYVVLEVENGDHTGYIKVNKKSLEKRLGLNSKQFKRGLKNSSNRNVTTFIHHEILKKQWTSRILNEESCFEDAPEELRDDNEFLTPFLNKNGLLLKDVSARAKKDWTMVLLGVRQNGLALQFADIDAFAENFTCVKTDESLSADLVFCTAFLQNGLALEHAPAIIQDNNTLVKIAYTQNNLSIHFASRRLQEKAAQGLLN